MYACPHTTDGSDWTNASNWPRAGLLSLVWGRQHSRVQVLVIGFWVSPLGTLLGHLRDAPGLLWTQGCLPSYSSIRKVAHEGEERREELWGPSMQTRIADALKGPHGRKLLRRQQFQKMEPASRGRAENKLPSVLPSQTILLTSAALGGL